MIKTLMFVAGLAAFAGAGSFVAPERAQAAPPLARSLTIDLESAKTNTLDSCQLKQYASCMQKFGDHGMCYYAAESYECPPE
ncbi:hypothetical protein [Brevundimonas sp.]|uniref:hypothetical protein n=1 Tax=Brevundimonas sp. TaxID=1871086 RepID=UPI001AC388AE|nr:hypothetical protein [Brevundimonas sp.]MBN9465067.1 hypothetical protein [Brevundimonas sp.]